MGSVDRETEQRSLKRFCNRLRRLVEDPAGLLAARCRTPIGDVIANSLIASWSLVNFLHIGRLCAENIICTNQQRG
jgi:hypothetical protein